MPLVWHAPKPVRLAFVVRAQSNDDDNVTVVGNWLLACDADHRGYRLPLPNLYEDCKLCTGQFDASYGSGAECVTASLEQFRKSKWNADLMRTVERSQKFFRFAPTNETFTTLPIEAEFKAIAATLDYSLHFWSVKVVWPLALFPPQSGHWLLFVFMVFVSSGNPAQKCPATARRP